MDQFFIHTGFSHSGIYYKNCYIHSVQHLFRLADAKFSKMSFIINTWCIYDHHRPIGSSSMALLTGSVVVPFTSDTTASSWPVTLFTILDFPTFLLPKNRYVHGLLTVFHSFHNLSSFLSASDRSSSIPVPINLLLFDFSKAGHSFHSYIIVWYLFQHFFSFIQLCGTCHIEIIKSIQLLI